MTIPISPSALHGGGCRFRRDPLAQVRRLASNQITYETAIGRTTDGLVDFVCECAGEGCRCSVELTIAEYEEVRRGGRQFLVSPCCACIFPPGDSVVVTYAGYAVVERVLQTLHCQECPATAAPDGDSAGWVAFLTDDNPPEMITYCPACAEREFGER
jgi:hypothetical protein